MLPSDRRRAFGWWFLAAVGINLALYMSNLYTALLDMQGDALLFFEYSRALGYTPLLMPLVSAIPFATALAEDFSGGFWLLTVSRSGRGRYQNSKFLAAVLSGGMAAALSMLLYAAFLVLRYPGDLSRVSRWVDTNYARDILKAGGLGNVAVFFLGVLLLQFLAGGFWAGVAITFSAYCPNAPLALCAPLVLYRLVDEIGGAVAFPAFLSPARLAEATAGLSFWPTMLAGVTVFPFYIAALYVLFRLGMKRRWRVA